MGSLCPRLRQESAKVVFGTVLAGRHERHRHRPSCVTFLSRIPCRGSPFLPPLGHARAIGAMLLCRVRFVRPRAACVISGFLARARPDRGRFRCLGSPFLPPLGMPARLGVVSPWRDGVGPGSDLQFVGRFGAGMSPGAPFTPSSSRLPSATVSTSPAHPSAPTWLPGWRAFSWCRPPPASRRGGWPRPRSNRDGPH